MREVLQSSCYPLYLKKRVYIWSYGEMSLKIGQNINFQPLFFFFFQLLGHDTTCLVTTQFLGRNTACLVMTQFLGCDTACLVATVSGQLLVFLLQLVEAITSSF